MGIINMNIFINTLLGIKKEVDSIPGIDIISMLDSSTLIIYEPIPYFSNVKLSIGKKCSITIEGSKYKIRNTNMEVLSENAHIYLKKNFSCNGALLCCGSNSMISIGDDCMFSSGIQLRTTDSHTIFDKDTKKVLNKNLDIYLENHVWVGNGARILKGSYIKNDSVIAMNGMVTKKINNPNVIIGYCNKILRNNISWSRSPIDEYEKDINI